MKALGVAAKDVGDDALKALSKVETPEVAVALKGKPRQQYLNALEDVYGPQAKRAEQSGKNLERIKERAKTEKFLQNKNLSIEEKNFPKELVEKYPNMFGEGHQWYDQLSNGEKIGEEISLKKSGYNDVILEPEFRGKGVYQKLLEDNAIKHGETNSLLANRNSNSNKTWNSLVDKGLAKRNLETGVDTISGPEIETMLNRSPEAAFDPRFAKSGLLMAGAGAIPQTDISPIPLLKKAFNTYDEAKNKIVEPLAKQLNFSKNPEDTETYKNVLSMGLDPLNFVSGPIGAGLSAIQLGTALTPDNEKEMKLKALKKMAGE